MRIVVERQPSSGGQTSVNRPCSNALIGQRLSITGPKPQTTRHRILGVVTREAGQILCSTRQDCTSRPRARHRPPAQPHGPPDSGRGRCPRAPSPRQGRWSDEDEAVWRALSPKPLRRACSCSTRSMSKRTEAALLPFIARITSKPRLRRRAPGFGQIRRTALPNWSGRYIERLPPGHCDLSADTLTDRSERFLAAELVREQLMCRLAQEVPYATTVESRSSAKPMAAARISAIIWVERAWPESDRHRCRRSAAEGHRHGSPARNAAPVRPPRLPAPVGQGA
jgi:GTP-binding protein Era